MITVRCSQCRSRLKVKPTLAGQRIKCPKCSAEIVVPALERGAAAPAAAEHADSEPRSADRSDPTGQAGKASDSQDPGPADRQAGGDFVSIDVSAEAPGYRKYIRRRKSRTPAVIVVVMLAVAAAAGAWCYFSFFRSEDDRGPLQVAPIADQTVQEFEALDVLVRADAAGGHNRLAYDLADAPDGASIDRAGRLRWIPEEDQGPGRYVIRVRVSDPGGKQADGEVEFSVDVTESDTAPEVLKIPDVEVESGSPIEFQVVADDRDIPPAELKYSLDADAPQGASLDPETGRFTWTPAAEFAGQRIDIPIHVTESVEDGLTTTETVTVTVSAPPTAVERLAEALRRRGGTVEIIAAADHELPFSGTYQLLKLNGQDVHLFEYESAEDMAHDVDQVSEADHTLFGEPWERDHALTLFRNSSLIAAYWGTDNEVRDRLDSSCGRAFAEVARIPPPETSQRSPLMETLVNLYEERNQRAQKERMLFSLRKYEIVRKAFSDEFERQYDFQIHSAFGDQYDEMMEWLNARPELKEELFTAFRPESDDVVSGLTLFRELRERFPKAIERYASLAIATAVTWDRERPGVYDYANHARRTKSNMPTNLPGGIDNFEYLVNAENYMQGRILYVPWEFLTLVVNHKTPLEERGWAMQNYLGKRVMFGKCYSEVPYDTQMLDTGSKVCRLAGKDYTLPNIRQFGGVCAMQADFASRVGKSIGVPAAYVTGPNRYGDLHAWVMWVELKAVSADSISFSLESHGRYRGDRYYVGSLREPQTGERTTDRLLALRLHSAGANTQAHRHARRIMQAYPELIGELRLGFDAELDFISQAVHLNPWNEDAWIALSKLSAAHADDFEVLQVRQMKDALQLLFTAFAPFPDFTLTVFDDLISFEPKSEERINLYFKLLDVYTSAQRPDLAFQALLKTADLLVDSGRGDDAIEALATAIKKYADEGEYVPKMLDKLEDLHSSAGGSNQTLARFYGEFLPLIPKKRGSRPSEYCIKMYERGIARFRDSGEMQLAAVYERQLAQLRGGTSQ